MKQSEAVKQLNAEHAAASTTLGKAWREMVRAQEKVDEKVAAYNKAKIGLDELTARVMGVETPAPASD